MYVNKIKFSCCDIYPWFCKYGHNCTYIRMYQYCINIANYWYYNNYYCACTYFIICTCISTLVISEPDDVTICEGREVVFTCVLNSNISDDVQWYRFINDTSTTVMVHPDGENINFITNTTWNTTSSSLTITNVTKSYTGYFWVETSSLNVCNASLTVSTSM